MKKIAWPLLLSGLICLSTSSYAELDSLAAAPLIYHLHQESQRLQASVPFDASESIDGVIVLTDEEAADFWTRTLASADEQQIGDIETAHALYVLGEVDKKAGNKESAGHLIEQAALKLQKIWEAEHRIEDVSTSSFKSHRTDYSSHSYLPSNVYKRLKTWIISKSHPLKHNLDEIFRTRVTQNASTFKEAGFQTLFQQKRSFIVVARHPKLPGHLLKAYLDTELRQKRHKPHWEWFARRCEGAAQVCNAITRFQLTHFVVPNKYVYPLPKHPAPPSDSHHDRKYCALLVEDMNLVPKEENLRAWKTVITKKHLNELYIIISFAHGASYRADNIAYSRNGKFAFIDTEYPTGGPDYHNIIPYLSPEMRDYWEKLVRSGGSLFKLDI